MAGATYAGYSHSARRLIQVGYPSRVVMGILFGIGAVLLMPVVAATVGVLVGTPTGFAVAAYLALVPMAFAYVLFGTGLRHIGAATATTLRLIEPVIAAILSIMIVGERLGPSGWTGAGLIIAGLIILLAPRAKQRPHGTRRV